VASVNPLAETLGRIFALPAETAATAQQVGMVVVVELLIAFALVAWKLFAPASCRKSPRQLARQNAPAAPLEAMRMPVRQSTREHQRPS
jgi:hypothetical protein